MKKTIGSVPVYATEGVGELTFGAHSLKILEEMMGITKEGKR